MHLSSVDRLRLESMLGMLGSDHPGERDNAAKLIEQFRRQRSLAWSDLLLPGTGRPSAASYPTDGSWRGLRPPTPPTPRPAKTWRSGWDAIWRGSMLIGLAAVGFTSWTSVTELRAIREATSAAQPAEPARATPAAPIGGLAAASPAMRPAKAEPSLAFGQGVADRKVWDNWHKSDAAKLCAGRMRDDQQELKSACVTAAKLLKLFEQRRKTDPEYLRGWNSPAAS